MKSKDLSAHAELMKFILGKWISKPIYVAAKLKIADHLSDGPKSIQHLARLVNAHTPSLYRIMRALACVGIFFEGDDGRFELTPMAACLKSDALRPVALMMHSDWHERAWNRLLESVQTGKIAFDAAHGMPIFEWFGRHPKAAAVYDQANAIKARTSHRAVVEAYTFSGIHTVMDVGGGTGALLVEILNANPALKGVIADLPRTVASAKAYIRAQGLAPRCAAIACDMFEKIPSGSDACLLSHILHDWEDPQCMVILTNIRKALPPGGRLLVVEALIPPPNQFSITKLLDLEVFVMGGGRERTRSDYRVLIESAGFEFTRVVSTHESVSILEAVKPDRAASS
jgi:ubiquinone/menaquinone biosynthesis C-methylase UbiE